MDIVSLGLTPNSSRSKKILKVINNNNRISLAIRKQIEKLNSDIKTFLATRYQQQEQQQEQQQKSKESEQLQKTFQDFYILLDFENFNFEKTCNVDLDKLRSIYIKAAEIKISDKDNKVLLDLMTEYMVLILSLKISNSLIYKTLILKNQQVYWETIYNSILNKLVYFVQTLPLRIYGFTTAIFQKTNQKVSATFQESSSSAATTTPMWRRIKHFTIAMAKSMVRSIKTVFIEVNPAITLFSKTQISVFSSVKWYITSIIKAPITIINKEIKLKLKTIKFEMSQNTDKLDQIIKGDVSNYLPTLVTIFNIDHDEGDISKRILQSIDSISTFDKVQYNSTSRPSVLTRYWPIIVLFIRYVPGQSVSLYNNRQEIYHWIQYNGIEPIQGFFVNWVVKPMNEMLNILRRDSGVTIMTRDSLESDFDSLEKMIWEFAQDNNIDTTPQRVASDVKNGDLRLIMSQYEQEIRKPIKYIISGSLLRLVLIQVQKGKVDGAVAINGIDKLLKSQQLVFGIVSMSPSLFILYQVYQYFTSDNHKPIMVNGKQLNIVCLKCLNNIENLLIMLQSNKVVDAKCEEGEKQQHHDIISRESYEGELLIEIINLIISSEPIIPKQLHSDWVKDLNELNNSGYDLETKLRLVNRIWNMYGSYFK
ncbi:NCA2 [Candida oxycetoniae]|uniref:NCA2 n=1 Tax=Candida oxycetoniae TaxID=497107 RepID=A0AAI9SZP6_9ASCO|nr:NCA2 [Candida oxycetoniae]KAI3406156.2 NCA2 [Candida oxycetoniae]